MDQPEISIKVLNISLLQKSELKLQNKLIFFSPLLNESLHNETILLHTSYNNVVYNALYTVQYTVCRHLIVKLHINYVI